MKRYIVLLALALSPLACDSQNTSHSSPDQGSSPALDAGLVDSGANEDAGPVVCDPNNPHACPSLDLCRGPGICDSTTLQCSPGAPVNEGQNCLNGSHSYCKQGVCTAPVCGNGIVEPGENCDDGNRVDHDGCNNNCTFTCSDPAKDCAAAACEKETCANHLCVAMVDSSKDGQACDDKNPTYACHSGACSASGQCGDGKIDPGEDCDLGPNNGPNQGCEINCKFSCTQSPDSCVTDNPCAGTLACTQRSVNTQTVQLCVPGSPLANGTVCGSSAGSCRVDRAICLNQVCVLSQCGDDFRDPACEQCDDGNQSNLDGCDNVCKFEENQRISCLQIQFAPGGSCTQNALGAAVVDQPGLARSMLRQSISDALKTSTTTVLFKALGLSDVTGGSNGTFQLGVMDGALIGDSHDGTDPNADLDWWYAASASSIDSQRNPKALLPAALSAQSLSAGPGSFSIKLNLAGAVATLRLANVTVKAAIDPASVSTPRVSQGSPPGHLATENLDPTLRSFGTMGQGSSDKQCSNPNGEICGDVGADSLAQLLLPDVLVSLCVDQHFTATNTLLDVFVVGCSLPLIGSIIQPTQPDVGGYTLVTNGTQVDHCVKDSQSVSLGTCLPNAYFSSYFRFSSNRVIIRNK